MSHSRVKAGFLAVAVILVSSLGAECAGPPIIIPPPLAAGRTVGDFADGGKTVFSTVCARCHGDRGEGVTAPPIIGEKAGLQKFETAKGLYDFVSIAMPFNRPGSLSPLEYQQVVAFLLKENNFVGGSTPFDADRLPGIALKK